MAFIIDKHTSADLEIFGVKGVKKGIFNFFDRTITRGGREELLYMFQTPLSDYQNIVDRQALIQCVYKEKITISFDKYYFDFIELYLQMINKPVKFSRFDAWHKAFKYMLKPTNEYFIVQRGIKYVIELLQMLYTYATEESAQNHPYLLKQMLSPIAETIQNTELKRIIEVDATERIGVVDRERFDYIFRCLEHGKIKELLRIVYQIDALYAVADSAVRLGLVFPEISEDKAIEITGLQHLFLKKGIANDVKISAEGNIFFITGANMAGKSTFLKAFGVAIYLAHIGFPVPAVSMRTGVFNGILSTINISDDLSKGYSHFYSEVLRVKSVAEEINRTQNMVVIFDELFRGTNVKDAYDASLAVISALSNVKGSVFLLSSHILELTEQLAKLKNIRFGYFKTSIEGKTPVYSYRLHDGVTEERLGMLILENERIVEIINGHLSQSLYDHKAPCTAHLYRI